MMSFRETLADAAAEVLMANDTGVFVKPGPGQYPGQWNWDAALITVGLAHLDANRARAEVRSLLSGQWKDGMIPHIVFHVGDVDYFPGPEIWGRGDGSLGVATSGITQPPLLASAVRRLHERHPSNGFLEEVVPAMERWHHWFQSRRSADDSLVTILHPWESGMDNSPRFDRALAQSGSPDTSFTRRDLVHVTAEQRPTDLDYAGYMSILETLRDAEYRLSIEEAPFAVGDVFLTAVLARAEADLAWLWQELGESGANAGARSDSLRNAIEDSWHEGQGLYCDAGGENEPATIAGVLPLVADVGDDRSMRLVTALLDPSRFGPSSIAPWYPTSVAKDDRRFEARRYWRGPVWVSVNWLLITGLENAGYPEEVKRLEERTLKLVYENGFWEYYDPLTGQGLGCSQFSWTAAAVLDLCRR
jgi:hypothetical protein